MEPVGDAGILDLGGASVDDLERECVPRQPEFRQGPLTHPVSRDRPGAQLGAYFVAEAAFGDGKAQPRSRQPVCFAERAQHDRARREIGRKACVRWQEVDERLIDNKQRVECAKLDSRNEPARRIVRIDHNNDIGTRRALQSRDDSHIVTVSRPADFMLFIGRTDDCDAGFWR